MLHSGDAPGAASGVVAGVIARSAAVGDNDQKKICACDGTVIWVRVGEANTAQDAIDSVCRTSRKQAAKSLSFCARSSDEHSPHHCRF